MKNIKTIYINKKIRVVVSDGRYNDDVNINICVKISLQLRKTKFIVFPYWWEKIHNLISYPYMDDEIENSIIYVLKECGIDYKTHIRKNKINGVLDEI